MIIAPLLAVSVACSAEPPSWPATSVPPTAVTSSAVPRAALGTAIDDYFAHGSINLQNIRAVLVSQRGELVAERYYYSDAAAYAEIHSATKECDFDLGRHRLDQGGCEEPGSDPR